MSAGLSSLGVTLSPGGLRRSSGVSSRRRQRALGGAGCSFLGKGLWKELEKQHGPASFQKRISGDFHRCEAAAALDQTETTRG